MQIKEMMKIHFGKLLNNDCNFRIEFQTYDNSLGNHYHLTVKIDGQILGVRC